MAMGARPERAFYFLRHGETPYNSAGVFQGRIDVPLNGNGLRQAEDAARRLSGCGISRIVASPAQRVLQTAAAVAELGTATIDVESDLMEFYVGSFEGKSIAQIRLEHGLGDRDSIFSVLPDDADQWKEFVPRIVGAVKRWTEKYAEDTILIAAHGLVFRSLAMVLTGGELTSRNAEPYLFTPNGGSYIVGKV
jgi:broad specificity phosphatase PhoE